METEGPGSCTTSCSLFAAISLIVLPP